MHKAISTARWREKDHGITNTFSIVCVSLCYSILTFCRAQQWPRAQLGKIGWDNRQAGQSAAITNTRTRVLDKLHFLAWHLMPNIGLHAMLVLSHLWWWAWQDIPKSQVLFRCQEKDVLLSRKRQIDKYLTASDTSSIISCRPCK